MKSMFRFVGLIASAFCISGFSQAAPPNDDWTHRTSIAELPFSDTVAGVEAATTETTDPNIFCWYQAVDPANPGYSSVWYGFTTGDADTYVDLDASGYDTIVAVYEGEPGAFVGVRGGCNDDGAGVGSGSVVRGLRLRANTRYSIVIARYTFGAGSEPMTLAFSMSPSAVYRVTKTDDGDDGVCDEDCSLREAVQQAIASPGAVLLPPGHYAVPGGLNFTNTNQGGANVYGSGMDETVIDAMGQGRVLLFPQPTGSRPRIFTYGLHDLTLSNGSTTGDGGAVHARSGYFVFDRVALTQSYAQNDGGGAALYSAATSIFESRVSGNSALGNGGGVFVRRDSLEVRDSTFSENASLSTLDNHGGGGLYLTDLFSDLVLSNTTVSGNRAARNAGGIYLDGVSILTGDWTAEMNNLSIVGNRFGEGGSASLAGGLLIQDSAVKISNSVMSGNYEADQPGHLSDCERTSTSSLVTGRYNLVQAYGTCRFLVAATNLLGLDPLLSPLGSYGSPLPLHLPLQGSPLIDAGDPDAGCVRTDARGIERPQDGNGDGTARCDIGAVEVQAVTDRVFADGFD